MKKSYLLPLFLLIPSIGGFAVNPPEGFTALFNGTDLTGWYGDNPHTSRKADDRATSIGEQQADFKAHWSVDGDEFVNDGKGPYATTDRDYGDIELMLEYKTVALADSGIYLRGSPQVQIWDTTEAGGKWHIEANKGSGGLYNNPKENADTNGKNPLVYADKPFGEWNTVRVRHVGDRMWVWLNGQLVVDNALFHPFFDKSKPMPKTGPIHLQTHGGEIRWRNVFVREIGAEEANGYLREDEFGSDFEPIFNGRNLDGWMGDLKGKAVSDGILKWTDGDNIYTKNEYVNFVFRFEFTMTPGGNNGLAIRSPGEGNPAYNAMCELQILDDGHENYAEIDPRQAHGSAYGMAGAHRGYLRPAGEWNYEEVAVDGSTIRVELNGIEILNTDLSQVTEYMADSEHPGKMLSKGHLGFSGHGPKHRFQFRRLSVKELD
jgi:hypothetical protein|tara:strand:- start:5584 stop:6882 length:1299 start_codon:yes stop_codon:yes gene_type:complete